MHVTLTCRSITRNLVTLSYQAHQESVEGAYFAECPSAIQTSGHAGSSGERRRYCNRRATTRSTRIARRAGIQQPSIAETTNTAEVTTSVMGSAGETSMSWDL